MNLKERVSTDFMVAYKAKEMEKKNFLGLIKGLIQTQEGKAIKSTDENVLKVIKTLEKGLIEMIDGKSMLGKDTTNEVIELSYLAPYLPVLMSEAEIKEKVSLIISESGEKNIGKLMGLFNKNYSGKADNKVVLNIIKYLT